MAANKIAVAVTGACGKVGMEMVKAVATSPHLELVGAVDIVNCGQDIGQVVGTGQLNVNVVDKIEAIFDNNPDVIIDFTNAKVAYKNIIAAIANGISVVSGTTGFSDDEIDNIRQICEEKSIGAIIAPNFALGAVLMFHICQEIAKWFNDAEIIEMHNPLKLDAPSGTAIRTAEIINREWELANEGKSNVLPQEQVKVARGEQKFGLPIHSVRLKGVVAHQEVIFGALGQTLTIKHDSYSRDSFVPGVMLAVNKVIEMKKFVFGLEDLIF